MGSAGLLVTELLTAPGSLWLAIDERTGLLSGLLRHTCGIARIEQHLAPVGSELWLVDFGPNPPPGVCTYQVEARSLLAAVEVAIEFSRRGFDRLPQLTRPGVKIYVTNRGPNPIVVSEGPAS